MQNKRKVLITGANRGLGLKLAEVLAGKYELILTARSLESLGQVKEKFEKQSTVLIHQLDVSNQESISKLKDWLVKENIIIDVLVNNAGVAKEPKDIIDINVLGTINVSEELLPLLSNDGKIILISSMLGKLERQSPTLQKQLSYPKTKEQIIQISLEYKSQPNQNLHQYSSSKALLNAYGRYILSALVKPMQSVFCVHPGWIKTDMGGQNAPGELDDGVVTSTFLIDTLPFGRDEQYHGKYFNDLAKVEDY